MKELNSQLKEQGLISSFGQPLGSSNLEEDCIVCMGGCITACIDCICTSPSC